MSNEPLFESGIRTNDGWVITLVSDKEISFGDAIIKSIIVQPQEDYAKRIAENPNERRKLYHINYVGEVIYESEKPQ
jgi:hypothetical protein